MTEDASSAGGDLEGDTAKALGHLLRQMERTQSLLEMLGEEMESPAIRGMVDSLRKATGLRFDDGMAQVIQKLEEAERAVRLTRSELVQPLESGIPGGDARLPSNLPPHLARFLAERESTPGFRFEVEQDHVRGWVIRWKEFTVRGTVRGSGQFSERPYAWLDE